MLHNSAEHCLQKNGNFLISHEGSNAVNFYISAYMLNLCHSGSVVREHFDCLRKWQRFMVAKHERKHKSCICYSSSPWSHRPQCPMTKLKGCQKPSNPATARNKVMHLIHFVHSTLFLHGLNTFHQQKFVHQFTSFLQSLTYQMCSFMASVCRTLRDCPHKSRVCDSLEISALCVG